MRKLTEAHILRAYVRLFLFPEDERSANPVALARHGAFEVRMHELPSDDLPLWLELYCHDRQTTIDFGACRDVVEALPLAEELTFWARLLHRRSRRH